MSRVGRFAAAAAVAAVASVGLAGTALAQDDPYDCGDFSTHAEAQRQFESTSGDPSGLDADNDGKACESLPSGAGDTGQTTGQTTGQDTGQTADKDAEPQVVQKPQGSVDAGNSADGLDTAALLGMVALTGAAGTAGATAMSARRARRNGRS